MSQRSAIPGMKSLELFHITVLKMHLVKAIVVWSFINCPFAHGVPAIETIPEDSNPLAQPFINAALPAKPGLTAKFDLFRRQGCPNQTLLCPGGVCCGYDTPCCGSVCCNPGYVCSGGTSSAPCCVAIGAQSNSCGSPSGNVSLTRYPPLIRSSS